MTPVNTLATQQNIAKIAEETRCVDSQVIILKQS